MSSSSNIETIFARASGAGKAGIAVFRLSGPESRRIAGELVGGRSMLREPKLYTLADPADGAVIDRGLVLFFEGPASFTGEDVAEFHLHGSRAVETALYETLTSLGARPAEAGEFTYRALKNDRLDLAQAEALADLIDAETSLQRKQALGQLDGRLSAVAEDWRARLLSIMAPLEADIDFPDEGDVPAAIAGEAGPAIVALQGELSRFLDESGRARMIRDGVSIAIIGPPNAGKSSLLNALAGSDIAIVSKTPGTTRDVVETRLDLGGIVATVADTAGLRTRTNDEIERIGMAKAKARAAKADIRILVLDPGSVSRETLAPIERDTTPVIPPFLGGAAPAAPAPIETPNDNRPVSIEGISMLREGDFLIWSKSDLGAAIPYGVAPDLVGAMSISAKTGMGVGAFLHTLSAAVSQGGSDGPALTRARHVQAVEEASDALSRAAQRLASAPELAAEDVRLAARSLGQITGAVGVEDVLGEIFSSFCIGK